MHDAPRYATLQDYLRVIRRQRLLIVAITISFAAVAYAISTVQTSSYTAEAQMSFRDVVQDLTLLGTTATPENSPDQRAAANAALITRPAVTSRVKKQLHSRLPLEALAGSVSAFVGNRTDLVVLQAHSNDPVFAARLANAYAHQAALVAKKNLDVRLNTAIASLKHEIRQGGSVQTPSYRQAVAQQQLTQLQTIRTIARPAEIGSAAQPPSSPTSPRPTRNALLGALLGLAAGLLVAFFRDSIDRRLRGPQEVNDYLQLPVLGNVHETALGHAGAASNGSGTVSEADLEAFRMLRTNLDFLSADRPLKSIAVTSGLPEEGKSTVAASLAGAAAAAGKRTLLVECDLRRSSLAERLGINPEPGLTDYLVGRAKPQEVLQQIDLWPATGSNGEEPDGETVNGGPEEPESEAPPDGGPDRGSLVCIVAGGSAPQPAELLASDRCRDFLAKVSKAYDLVILDTSPLLSVADALSLIPNVDGVIVCVRLSQTTREEAKATKTALDHLPERPTGVVVTGVSHGDEGSYGYYAYGYAS